MSRLQTVFRKTRPRKMTFCHLPLIKSIDLLPLDESILSLTCHLDAKMKKCGMEKVAYVS